MKLILSRLSLKNCTRGPTLSICTLVLLITGCSKVAPTVVHANEGYDHTSALVVASRVSSAESAVVVSVDSTQSSLETNEYNDHLIRTTVSAHVAEVLKGDTTQKNVSFVVDGGTVGTKRMLASDMPTTISKGNRFVVLLKHPPTQARVQTQAVTGRMELSGRRNGLLPIGTDADLVDFKNSLAKFQ